VRAKKEEKSCVSRWEKAEAYQYFILKYIAFSVRKRNFDIEEMYYAFLIFFYRHIIEEKGDHYFPLSATSVEWEFIEGFLFRKALASSGDFKVKTVGGGTTNRPKRDKITVKQSLKRDFYRIVCMQIEEYEGMEWNIFTEGKYEEDKRDFCGSYVSFYSEPAFVAEEYVANQELVLKKKWNPTIPLGIGEKRSLDKLDYEFFYVEKDSTGHYIAHKADEAHLL
jgi:hypothetical protein